jgi:alkylhydroperoxidase/carboxymuconolactone decarboxylase family protein YurZ
LSKAARPLTPAKEHSKFSKKKFKVPCKGDTKLAEKKALKKLEAFKEEFGKILDPVAFIKEKNEGLCDAFLGLHELTVNEGVISKKLKFLMHAAMTAALHDVEATVMHLTGAVKAGATDKEILETAFTIIPVAGMPAFAVFLNALKRVKPSLMP